MGLTEEAEGGGGGGEGARGVYRPLKVTKIVTVL